VILMTTGMSASASAATGGTSASVSHDNPICTWCEQHDGSCYCVGKTCGCF
jgi:hypothetical protein